MRGDTLQLRSRCPLASFRCAVILGAQVPTSTAAAIRTRAAAVAVQGLSGPVDIATESGAATVERAAGQVHLHGITDDPTATRTIAISTGGGIVLTGT